MMSRLPKDCLSFALATVLLSGCKTANFRSVDDVPQKSLKAEETKTLNSNATLPALPPEPPVVVEKEKEKEPEVVTAPKVGTLVEEKFVQLGKKGDADILIVIDDSDTMGEEQANLAAKLNDLLVEVKDSKWQIGVITTTVVVENGFDKCVLTLIKSTEAGYQEKFRNAVSATNGSRNEQGIRQAVNGLRCAATPWVRPNSTLAVLIVSDEDNCSSNGSECPSQPSKTERYLINYVENDMERVVGVNAGFYGIFSPPAAPCKTAENVATQYQKLVNYGANGSMNYGNICDTSYTQTLQRISKNIAQLLGSQFNLKGSPDMGTLKVTGTKANGSAIQSRDYSVRGQTLNFSSGNEPALNTEIVVTYKVTAP
ncbi:MAG: hypothetical protein EOP04_12065 [Proteobacteria bacterium]|nr:MAG: hypothetical protein EOP04_12065 [Pseudomonadota bacterium]